MVGWYTSASVTTIGSEYVDAAFWRDDACCERRGYVFGLSPTDAAQSVLSRISLSGFRGAAALHAAAHVTMEFDKSPPKTELYNLTLDGSEWRLDFDFAELLGHED